MTELEYYKTRNRILDAQIVDLYAELYDLTAAYERKCEEVEYIREDYIRRIRLLTY